jgi:hypothetical protein
MADDDNRDQLVKLLLVGGAGFAAYKLLYVPYAFKQEVLRRTEEEARALAAKGMGLEEATQKALAGACIGVAAVYKVPPSVSAGVCQGVGVLAEKTLKATAKGAIIAGKAIGSGVKTGVLAVGSGVKTGVLAVGSGVKTGAKAVGTGAKFVSYTAPKEVLKFTAYTAPKKVITTAASGVATGAKAVGSTVAKIFGGGSSKVCRAKNNKDVFPNDMRECKARYGITDCNACGMLYDVKLRKWPDVPGSKWGLMGLGDAVAAATARRQLAGKRAPLANPFAEHARRRAGGKVSPGRKRRSLAGVSGAAPARRASGAEFYTRHLK